MESPPKELLARVMQAGLLYYCVCVCETDDEDITLCGIHADHALPIAPCGSGIRICRGQKAHRSPHAGRMQCHENCEFLKGAMNAQACLADTRWRAILSGRSRRKHRSLAANM